MLERRTLVGFDSRYPAIEAVGGMYVVTTDTDPHELAAAIASGHFWRGFHGSTTSRSAIPGRSRVSTGWSSCAL